MYLFFIFFFLRSIILKWIDQVYWNKYFLLSFQQEMAKSGAYEGNDQDQPECSKDLANSKKDDIEVKLLFT